MLSALIPALCLVGSLARAKPLPSFALEYAPLLYLHSKETHWPSDVSVFLEHVKPMRNGETDLSNDFPRLTDSILSDVRLDNSDVFLTSRDDPTRTPQAEWIVSEYGKPDSSGKSAAPCFAVVVDKTGVHKQHPEGDVDVFYFTFFSFSAGLEVPVLKKVLGSHMGDWEHSMIRFKDGKPVAVYVSRHGGGSAFTYEAVEKKGKRPVFYIAKGSHATYAVKGKIDFASTGLVWDLTEKGLLLDPALNLAGFFHEAGKYTAADGTDLNTAVLTSKVTWGDKQLPKIDPRQSEHASFLAWADGPAGISNKTIVRVSMGPRPQQGLDTVLPVIVEKKPETYAEQRARERKLAKMGEELNEHKKKLREAKQAEAAKSNKPAEHAAAAERARGEL